MGRKLTILQKKIRRKREKKTSQKQSVPKQETNQEAYC